MEEREGGGGAAAASSFVLTDTFFNQLIYLISLLRIEMRRSLKNMCHNFAKYNHYLVFCLNFL